MEVGFDPEFPVQATWSLCGRCRCEAFLQLIARGIAHVTGPGRNLRVERPEKSKEQGFIQSETTKLHNWCFFVKSNQWVHSTQGENYHLLVADSISLVR